MVFDTVFGVMKGFYEDSNIKLTVITHVLNILTILRKSKDIYLVTTVLADAVFLFLTCAYSERYRVPVKCHQKYLQLQIVPL